MKTALSEYIEDLKTGNCKGEEYYIALEKNNLENFYIQGFCHSEYEGVMDFDKYYTSTFETNKETLK